MSVRLTSQERKVAMFCSTSGVAFGPVFDTEHEAERFIQYVRDNYDRDPRALGPRLMQVYRQWQAWEPTDVEMFGAGSR